MIKTIYYKLTGEVIGCEFDPKETEEIGVTELLCSQNFIKCSFNGKVFYEGADSELIAVEREKKITDLRAECRKKLLPTDWYIIRKLERDVPIPENISIERTSILDDYNNQILELN